jgi:hypothetical protein
MLMRLKTLASGVFILNTMVSGILFCYGLDKPDNSRICTEVAHALQKPIEQPNPSRLTHLIPKASKVNQARDAANAAAPGLLP